MGKFITILHGVIRHSAEVWLDRVFDTARAICPNQRPVGWQSHADTALCVCTLDHDTTESGSNKFIS